jgi:hypothetical protein
MVPQVIAWLFYKAVAFFIVCLSFNLCRVFADLIKPQTVCDLLYLVGILATFIVKINTSLNLYKTKER